MLSQGAHFGVAHEAADRAAANVRTHWLRKHATTGVETRSTNWLNLGFIRAQWVQGEVGNWAEDHVYKVLLRATRNTSGTLGSLFCYALHLTGLV